MEERSLAALALDRNRSAHALRQIARDRKAKAGAAETARRIVAGLREFLEDASLFLGRHADAGIGDLGNEIDLLAVGLARRCRKRDRHAAGFGELDGVAGEIEEDLAQAQFIDE